MNIHSRPKYLTDLCTYICDTRLEDLPPTIIDRGRWIIADSLAVIAAGMQIEEMKALVKRHLVSRTSGHASVIGAHVKADPMDAALLNGTAGTWLELDEGNQYAKGHPGIQVVPAAFAVAQEDGVSGRDLLLAVILGYEACSRIHRATKTRLAVHPHGTYGVIGAAVAVALLRGCEPEEMQKIVNISSTMGLATSRRTLIEGATVRNIYSGMSGYMGILAHRLAQSGFTGENDGVRSVYGSVYADEFNSDLVVEGLGQHFVIGQNYFKLHSCGRYIHSALDLVDMIAAQRPNRRIDPDAVERIDINAYFMASTLSEKSVTNSFGVKFSVPFAVATLIYHGKPSVSNFDERAVANPTIQSLAQRVNIKENQAYTAQYPAKQLCDMQVQFKDGSVAEAKAEITKGEADNPHSVEEMQEKFFGLTSDIWGKEKARAVYEGLMSLNEVEDIRAFTTAHPI